MPETDVKQETSLTRPPQQATSIQRAPSTSFAPRTLDEAIVFCKFLANSDLVPKDYRDKPENVLVAIQMGAELGIAPMQALSGIAVINGRGAVWGDLMLAIIMSHPAYEWHKEWVDGEGDNRAAHCQMKRRGQEVHAVRFSMADAKKAGLLDKDSPWKKYPDRMMQMRARGFGARDKFADALKGIVSVEEAMDYEVIPGGDIQYSSTSTSSSTSSTSVQPDPLDQFITPEEAKGVWDLAKKNGHVVKADDGQYIADGYKKALKDVGHCDRSDKLTKRHYEAMKAFVSKPAQVVAPQPEQQQEKPVDNPDAEPCGDGGQQ
jgi:hypothetical protein